MEQNVTETPGSEPTGTKALSESSVTCTISVLCFVLITAPTGDIVLLGVTLRSKSLRRPLNILWSSIMVADILFVLTVLPVNIATLLDAVWPPNAVVCYLQSLVTICTISTPACSIGSVSVYRLTQVCYNSIYNRIKQPKWLAVVIGLVWAEPILVHVIFVKDVEFIDYRFACSPVKETVSVAFLFFIFLPVVLTVIICYGKIYFHSRKIFQSTGEQPLPSTTSDSPDVHKRKDGAVFSCIMIIFLEIMAFYIVPGVFGYIRNKLDAPERETISLISFTLIRVLPFVRLLTTLVCNRELRHGVKALLFNK